MEKTANGWNIIDKDAGVLTYEYAFNPAGGTAHTWIARIGDGQLLAISPGKDIPDAAFADLDEYGKIVAVVAPNGFHHLGQGPWRKRFPEARFFAAPEAAQRIKSKSDDAGDFESMSALQELLGDAVGVRESPGTKVGETWAWAKTGNGYAWYASDLFCNWETFPGNFLLNFMWKLTKSGPGFKIFHFAMMAIMKDKKVALRALREDMKAHPPTAIVLGHGPEIMRDGLADEVDRMIAAAL